MVHDMPVKATFSYKKKKVKCHIEGLRDNWKLMYHMLWAVVALPDAQLH